MLFTRSYEKQFRELGAIYNHLPNPGPGTKGAVVLLFSRHNPRQALDVAAAIHKNRDLADETIVFSVFDVATPAGLQFSAVVGMNVTPIILTFEAVRDQGVVLGYQQIRYLLSFAWPSYMDEVWAMCTRAIGSVEHPDREAFRAQRAARAALNEQELETLEQLEVDYTLALSRRDMEREGRRDTGLQGELDVPNDGELDAAFEALNEFLAAHGLPLRTREGVAEPAAESRAESVLANNSPESESEGTLEPATPAIAEMQPPPTASLPGSPDTENELTLIFRVGDGRQMLSYPASTPAGLVAQLARRALLTPETHLIIGRTPIEDGETRPLSEFMPSGRTQIPAKFE